MKNVKKSLVLFSGGIDSGVLLWWAKKRGYKLATLSFQFPGRRRGEIKAVSRLRELSGAAENFDLFLPFVDPPKSEESCYIPQRNLMYYGIAASLAEKIGATLILGGHIRHDGAVFKDAAPAFFAKLQKLIQPARNRDLKIALRFPFIGLDKRDIIKTGVKLRVPFAATWSCSKDVSTPCGKCGSCKERSSGFAAAKIEDPFFQ